MPKRIVVTFADNHSSYLAWQDRLLKSLDSFGVEYLAWREQLPPGSPTHVESPYAFKCFSVAEAEKQGFTSILWCDSAVWARKDPAVVFDLMEKQGHVFWRNGWACGQWCTDAALDKHGVTRDEAMKISDYTGCCMGLDLTHERSREFMRRWMEAATDGISFVGSWNNDGGQCSADKRCMGHRHDQVIGSMIAHSLDMQLSEPGDLFSYWCGGKVNDTVVMVNGRG